MQATYQAVDAGKVAELEAAQAAAQGALLAEMDLLRRQKAAAEEQARRFKFPSSLCSCIAAAQTCDSRTRYYGHTVGYL